MSFDATFDYTPALDLIGNLISSCEIQIQECDDTLASFGTIVGHDTICSDAVNTINTRKNALETITLNNVALQTEMGNIQALASGTKSVLYNLYNVTTVVGSASRFQGRLVWQHETLYNAAEPFLIDGNLSGAEKTMLGEHLLSMYPLTNDGEDVSNYLQQLP